jgi:hypothetical protein
MKALCKPYATPKETLWYHKKPLCKPYEKHIQTYENHMATLCIPMKTIWNPYGKFYCILCGAKRRGERLSVFTVYYAARSAAAKYWVVLLCITRREAPRRIFKWFHCVLCGAQRRGEILECFYGTSRQILRNIRNPSQFECFNCVLRSAMRRGAQLGGSTVPFILCGA